MGSPGRAVSLHLARSGSQSEHRIRRILPARGACYIIRPVTCVLYLPPMASAQVVQTSVANDIPPQDYSQPDGHFQSSCLFIALELVARSMSTK